MRKKLLEDKTALFASMFSGTLKQPRLASGSELNWGKSTKSVHYLTHFRYYSSNIGRFLKPDNIIPDAFNPQSWNLYAYVRGNPVNLNDPTGHQGEEAKAKLPESGGDPNTTKEGKEQAKEEQTGNKDTTDNTPPKVADCVMVQVAIMGIEVTDLSMGLMGLSNPVSEGLKEPIYEKAEEMTGTFKGKENLQAIKETLGGGLSLLRTTSFVAESTSEAQAELALNTQIVAAGGEASTLTGGVMQSGLTSGAAVALGVVSLVSGWTIGSVIRENIMPDKANEAIGDKLLDFLTTSTDFWGIANGK